MIVIVIIIKLKKPKLLNVTKLLNQIIKQIKLSNRSIKSYKNYVTTNHYFKLIFEIHNSN
jgi:hypothetical protein